jgi:hypothetical protein
MRTEISRLVFFSTSILFSKFYSWNSSDNQNIKQMKWQTGKNNGSSTYQRR